MDLSQQGLISGIAAPQGEALDAFTIEMNLATDQPVRPQWIDRDTVAEQVDMALLIGTTQVDQASSQRCIEIEPPAPGNGRRGGACSIRAA
jgi:hypothetical protein